MSFESAGHLLPYSIWTRYQSTMQPGLINLCWCFAGTLIGNTDTKWYLNLTHDVYRFCALENKMEDTRRYHGFNERISVDNYIKLVNFYYRVLRNADLLSDGKDRKLHRYTEL